MLLALTGLWHQRIKRQLRMTRGNEVYFSTTNCDRWENKDETTKSYSLHKTYGCEAGIFTNKTAGMIGLSEHKFV